MLYDDCMRYWLFKTEPSAFSYDHLAASPAKTAAWDGVRNFQANNYLRDEVAVGDQVFIYHSSIPEPAIVGIAEVVRAGYPDHTAWDPNSDHYDPRSTPQRPLWYMVDVKALRKIERAVTLRELKHDPNMKSLSLFSRPRLSIHPIYRQGMALHP